MGMAAALSIDGQSPGHLSDSGFFVLPLLGLLILLPQMKGWLIRLLVAIVYVGAELALMFVWCRTGLWLVWRMYVA